MGVGGHWATRIARGAPRKNSCTRTLDTRVSKFLPAAEDLPENRGCRALGGYCPAHPTPSPPAGTERSAPARPRRARPAPRDSLLGRAPHRGPRLPGGRRLPALPRRCSCGARRRRPCLPRRLLSAARARPRDGLRHGPPPQRFSRLWGTRGPSSRGARLWPPPPLCCQPASEGTQSASARVTAARLAASDPRRGGRAREGGESAAPPPAPARTEPPARGADSAAQPLRMLCFHVPPARSSLYRSLRQAGWVEGGETLKERWYASSESGSRKARLGCEGRQRVWAPGSVSLGLRASPSTPPRRGFLELHSRDVGRLSGVRFAWLSPRGSSVTTRPSAPPAPKPGGSDLPCGLRLVAPGLGVTVPPLRQGEKGQLLLLDSGSVCSWTVFFQIGNLM